MVSIKNIGFVALCAAATAFAQSKPAQPSMQPAPQTQQFPAPKDAKALLEDLHQTNQEEIKLAQEAEQKAVSPQTKQFAQQLIQDHQQLDQQVQQVAKQMKVTLGRFSPSGRLEKNIQDVSKDIGSALQNAQGATWDTLFLSNQVIDHDAQVQMLRSAQTKFQNQPQVAQLVTTALPIMSRHQQMAAQALSQVVQQNQAVGGAGMRGLRPEERPSSSGY